MNRIHTIIAAAAVATFASACSDAVDAEDQDAAAKSYQVEAPRFDADDARAGALLGQDGTDWPDRIGSTDFETGERMDAEQSDRITSTEFMSDGRREVDQTPRVEGHEMSPAHMSGMNRIADRLDTEVRPDELDQTREACPVAGPGETPVITALASACERFSDTFGASYEYEMVEDRGYGRRDQRPVVVQVGEPQGEGGRRRYMAQHNVSIEDMYGEMAEWEADADYEVEFSIDGPTGEPVWFEVYERDAMDPIMVIEFEGVRRLAGTR